MMVQKHGPGCRCAECLSSWARREQACREMFALLGLAWLGLRHGIEVARLIKAGITEWLPDHARQRLAVINKDVLESLLQDILE